MIFIVFAIACWRRHAEPTYRGIPLSKWLEDMPSPNRFVDVAKQDAPEPVRALFTMGTNAVPYLLDSLAVKDSIINKTLLAINGKQRVVRFPVIAAQNRRLTASYAFGWLGDSATYTIPQLAELLHDPELVCDVALVLTCLGPEGFRALATGLTNSDPMVSYFTAVNLTLLEARIPTERTNEWVRRFQREASTAIPALVQALTNANPKISHAAATALGDIGHDVQLVVPALSNLVNRPETPASTRIAARRSIRLLSPPSNQQ